MFLTLFAVRRISVSTHIVVHSCSLQCSVWQLITTYETWSTEKIQTLFFFLENTAHVQWIRCSPEGSHLIHCTSVVFSHFALKLTPLAYRTGTDLASSFIDQPAVFWSPNGSYSEVYRLCPISVLYSNVKPRSISVRDVPEYNILIRLVSRCISARNAGLSTLLCF